MTNKQLGRVRGFLRLGDNEVAEVKESARELKTAKDPIRYGMTDDVEGIAAARSSSTPADEFLGDQTRDATAKAQSMKEGAQLFSIESTSEADAAADALKNPVGTSVSLNAKNDILEQSGMASSELAYAKDVEMRNGRYAMMGFLAAILVESATGHGIIMQIIDIFKLTGLLGAESGF
uniref:High light inducible protein n=1 Tax=Tetraselmis chuii TaxID=63592 RepID=A0A7S1WXN0_9CHLO|mmetsp:Transcript_10419/g.18883  ORF Transcript_10419/g.18883 Transcript_10419/m.18883 type:complete len:178 (+) Transcript_10419:2-535(+)